MNSDDLCAANWLHIIEALGLTPDRPRTPASMLCPLCQKSTLYVYHDPLRLEWMHCGRCGFAGDAIGLAAKVWKLNERDTINKLILSGALKTTEAFIKTYVDEKTNPPLYERLWADLDSDFDAASRFVPGYPTSMHAVWRYDLKLGTRAALVKLNTRSHLHQNMVPRHWKEFAAIPLERMPGHTLGLYAIYDEKQIVLCDPNSRETLILGLGKACAAKSHYLLVSDDMEHALELQFRFMRTFFKPAPVCAMYNRGAYAAVWRQLQQRVVFWGKAPTIELFREAASCNGFCVIKPNLPSTGDLRMQFAKLNDQARPWFAVLTEYLLGMIDNKRQDEIRNFVLSIGLSTSELTQLINKTVPEIQQILGQLINTTSDAIRYDCFDITRQGDELFVCRIGVKGKKPLSEKRIRISDTTLLIHKISDGAEAMYAGEILHRGRSYRFEDKLEVMEANPELWLRRQLWRKGVGEPYVHPSWRKRLIDLGLRFGEAVYSTNKVEPGWSFELNGLATNNWFLSRSGKFEEWSEPRTKLPGRIAVPIPMTRTAIDALSDMPGASVFWTVTAQVVASLLSPLTGRTPKNLLLLGNAARDIGATTAKLSGCHVIGTLTLPQSTGLQEQLQASTKARWPVLLLADPNYGHVPELLLDDQKLSAIYRPHNELRGIELLIGNDCNLLHASKVVGDMAVLRRFGADVLPAYLRDLADREFRLFFKDDPTASVLTDMTNWWTGLGGTANMHTRFFHGVAKTRQCFYRLLMLCRSKLYGIPMGFSEFLAEPKIPIETDNQFMYLEPARLQRAMFNRAQLDMRKLGQDLLAAELLLNDPEEKIWTIPISVWETVVRAATHPTRREYNTRTRMVPDGEESSAAGWVETTSPAGTS